MSDRRCKCSMAISLTGDGCRYCQPQEYIDRLEEWLDEERQQLAESQARCAELEADARRYQFIRANQYWQRKEPGFDEPGFDLIGVKFEKDNGFTAKIYLDHAIDKRLRTQADKLENN